MRPYTLSKKLFHCSIDRLFGLFGFAIEQSHNLNNQNNSSLDLVIRVVILFNFQLPVVKDRAGPEGRNECIVYHFCRGVRKGENEEK